MRLFFKTSINVRSLTTHHHYDKKLQCTENVIYDMAFALTLSILKYISDLYPTTGNLYRSKLDIGSSANYGITGLFELLMI